MGATTPPMGQVKDRRSSEALSYRLKRWSIVRQSIGLAAQAARYGHGRQYEQIKQIGRGSQSDVFLVRDTESHTLYVQKRFLKARMPHSAMREVGILKKLREHPAVVTVYDAYEEEHHYCVIVQYCDGGDLGARIAERARNNDPFTDDEILDYLAQLASAINFAHRKSIIHRDVKPTNVFLRADGRVALGDFGVAKELEGELQSVDTVVGTPYYLPPETVRGEPYTSKADIWALGVVVHELAMFARPFEAKSIVELAHKVQNEDPPPLPAARSQELRRLVRMALEKDPDKRANAAQIMRVPALHVRILRERSFSPSQLVLPVARRPRNRPQTVVHAVSGEGFAQALNELHKLPGKLQRRAASVPNRVHNQHKPGFSPEQRDIANELSMGDLGAVEPAPEVQHRSAASDESPDHGGHRSGWPNHHRSKPARRTGSGGGGSGDGDGGGGGGGLGAGHGEGGRGSAMPTDAGGYTGGVDGTGAGHFDLSAHPCTCERSRSVGTLYVTATSICFLPFIGGRAVSIDINAIACLVKAKVFTVGCGTGHSLWIAVTTAAPAGDDSTAEEFHIEKFHGFTSRDEVVENICQAGLAGGYSIPVYAQSGLYKATQPGEALSRSSVTEERVKRMASLGTPRMGTPRQSACSSVGVGGRAARKETGAMDGPFTAGKDGAHAAATAQAGAGAGAGDSPGGANAVAASIGCRRASSTSAEPNLGTATIASGRRAPPPTHASDISALAAPTLPASPSDSARAGVSADQVLLLKGKEPAFGSLAHELSATAKGGKLACLERPADLLSA